MAADPFGRGVDDDVRTVLDGLRQQRREGVVDDDRHAVLVSDVGDGLEVVDVQAGVADELKEDRLGLVIDGAVEGGGVGAIHEGSGDADLGQRVLEQVVGAAVQAGAADKVIAGACQVEDAERLGGLAGGHPQGRHAALEGSHALLEDVRGRVHDAGVDVPELLEPEQARGVRGVVEDVAGGGVDRHRAGVGGRVDPLAGVQRQRVGAKGGLDLGIESCHVMFSVQLSVCGWSL